MEQHRTVGTKISIGASNVDPDSHQLVLSIVVGVDIVEYPVGAIFLQQLNMRVNKPDLVKEMRGTESEPGREIIARIVGKLNKALAFIDRLEFESVDTLSESVMKCENCEH